MGTATFREFIELLDRDGELARVKARVSPVLEISEICDRICKTKSPHGHAEVDRTIPGTLGGKALLFENVEGSDIPVAINTFGSYHRMNLALGTKNLEELASRVQQLVKPEIPTTLMEKMKRLPDLMKMASYPPKIVRTGICQQIVLEGDRADLTKLPLIQCWPLDGDRSSDEISDHARHAEAGQSRHRANTSPSAESTRATPKPAIATSACIACNSSASACARCTGTCTTTVRGTSASTNRAARKCRWQSCSAANPCCLMPPPPRFRRESKNSCSPASSTAVESNSSSAKPSILKSPPTPRSSSKATSIRTKRCSKARSATTPASIRWPIAIPRFTSPRSRCASDPIYPTTIVGKPPMEDYFLGKATERIFLPLLKMIVPDIVDYDLPISGAFHNCAFIKIRKEYPYQARRVMHAIWGAGQMSFTKFIIVVDEHVDVHDEQDVLFHLFATVTRNATPKSYKARSISSITQPPEMGVGSKIGFDATIKLPQEGRVRRYPQELQMDAKTKELVTRKWSEYGLE